jgi:hypothetical protein
VTLKSVRHITIYLLDCDTVVAYLHLTLFDAQVDQGCRRCCAIPETISGSSAAQFINWQLRLSILPMFNF